MSAADIVAIQKPPEGGFLPWIEAKFEMSERTARNFMTMFEYFGADRKRVADLTPSALYLFAAPSTPEPVNRFRLPVRR